MLLVAISFQILRLMQSIEFTCLLSANLAQEVSSLNESFAKLACISKAGNLKWTLPMRSLVMVGKIMMAWPCMVYNICDFDGNVRKTSMFQHRQDFQQWSNEVAQEPDPEIEFGE